MRFFKAFLFSVLLLFVGGCSQKQMIPSDTKVYGSPADHGIRYSEHRFSSGMGGDINGWWLENRTGACKGVVLLVPGAVHNISYHYRQWIWLLDEGYDVFMFDYRTYGDSKGEKALKGFVADTRAAMEYVSRNTQSDLFVCGQSMGGVILVNALEHYHNDKIKLVVIDAAFSRFRLISRDIVAKSVIMSPLWWVPSLVTERRFDAIDKVSAIRTPTLYLTGTADRTVSPDYLFLLFMEATSPRELWLVQGAGHVQSLQHTGVRRAFVKLLGDVDGAMNSHVSALKMYADE